MLMDVFDAVGGDELANKFRTGGGRKHRARPAVALELIALAGLHVQFRLSLT